MNLNLRNGFGKTIIMNYASFSANGQKKHLFCRGIEYLGRAVMVWNQVKLSGLVAKHTQTLMGVSNKKI